MIGEARVGVYAWIERDGMVLLTLWQGAPEQGVDPRWGLPGGGVEWGEQIAEALAREVFEETGHHIDEPELLAVQLLDVDGAGRLEGTGDLRLVRVLCRAAVSGGELTHEVGGSTLRAAWFPLGELGALPTVDLVAWGLRAVGHTD